jgi:hypothetical protein
MINLGTAAMNNPIDEYEAILERIFSVYLDATEGIRYIARDAKVLVSPQTPKVRAKNAQGVSRLFDLRPWIARGWQLHGIVHSKGRSDYR